MQAKKSKEEVKSKDETIEQLKAMLKSAEERAQKYEEKYKDQLEKKEKEVWQIHYHLDVYLIYL